MVISMHEGIIHTIAYLSDGRVVTGSSDGSVKVYNLKNRREEGTMKHEGNVYSCAVTRDGTKIIIGSAGENLCSSKINMWDVESHELVKQWIQLHDGITISPDSRLIAVGYYVSVAFYTTEWKRVDYAIKDVRSRINSICFSPDGKQLACGTFRGDVRVYDVKNGALLLDPLQGHRDLVCCILWSPNGNRLFSASADKTICCWNSDTGEQIGRPWTGHTDEIRSLSISPDGSIIASASMDRTVRFWDATTGYSVGQHLQHKTKLEVVCFSPCGKCVAAAGWDGKLYLWRLPSVESKVIPLIMHVTRVDAHQSPL